MDIYDVVTNIQFATEDGGHEERVLSEIAHILENDTSDIKVIDQACFHAAGWYSSKYPNVVAAYTAMDNWRDILEIRNRYTEV